MIPGLVYARILQFCGSEFTDICVSSPLPAMFQGARMQVGRPQHGDNSGFLKKYIKIPYTTGNPVKQNS